MSSKSDKAAEILANAASIDGGLLEKMAEVENELYWRRFFVAGGSPILIVHGKGTNTNAKIFDQQSEEMWELTSYEPRYDPEYINMSKSQGFWKYLTFFDEETQDLKTCNFADINNYIIANYDSDGVQQKTGVAIYKKAIAYIVALKYWCKFDIFCETYELQRNFTASTLEKIMKISIQSQELYLSRMQQLMNVPYKEIVSASDPVFGIMLAEKYAFVDASFFDRRASLQKQYDEYRISIFEALKNVTTLQLCDNSIKGNIQGTDISINQTLNCQQQFIDNTGSTTSIKHDVETKATDGDLPKKTTESEKNEKTITVKQEVTKVEETKNFEYYCKVINKGLHREDLGNDPVLTVLFIIIAVVAVLSFVYTVIVTVNITTPNYKMSIDDYKFANELDDLDEQRPQYMPLPNNGVFQMGGIDEMSQSLNEIGGYAA